MTTIPNGTDLWSGGCSAVGWSTEDGVHLWGRNMDFNRMAAGTAVTYLPAGTALASSEGVTAPSKYAALGMGLLAVPGMPLLYEGVNDAGLMGGQLYFRGFAHYADEPRPGTAALQPPLLVGWLLGQCATVEEVARVLSDEVTLVARPLLGTVPPLHWSFSDRSGEVMVVESDSEGLHLYRNTVGVMTNSPSYAWHRLNLLNYAGIRDLDYDTVEVCGEELPQCFSGSGAQGLPGDWSSPSRFIRLAMLRKYAVRGKTERQGIARLFRIMESAAFPLGMVRVSQPGGPTELDENVQPWDYTLYTAVYCAETGRCSWTTYDNPAIRTVTLADLKDQTAPVQLPLETETDLKTVGFDNADGAHS